MLLNERANPCRGLIEFVFRGACCFHSENVGTAFVAVGHLESFQCVSMLQ